MCKECKNIKHFEGSRVICRECKNIKDLPARKRYKQNNKDILREKRRIYHKNRLANDPYYKAKISARNLIRKSLSKKGYTKTSKTSEILCCSYEYFKSHIESI